MDTEIKVEQGTVRGGVKTTYRGKPFFSFEGIPYAQPPTGDLRFKAPEPPARWSRLHDASKPGRAAFARNQFRPDVIQGGEDCLNLNIYTKELPGDEQNPFLPVMVYIHGGAFVHGTGNAEECGPDFLLTENFVLVTVNYRLGLLGFLALDDPTLKITGNAGMRDIIQALKWIKSNIMQFAGNPENVTIFGESAGGAAVHFLVLSPLTKGLFQRAIAQSGSALNPWAMQRNCCKEIAEHLKIANEPTAILDVLRKKNPHELLELQEALLLVNKDSRPIGITIDSNAEHPFLPDAPIALLRNGNFQKVPFMTGYTNAEGMLFEWDLINVDFDLTLEKLYFPPLLGYVEGTPQCNKAKADLIKFYSDCNSNRRIAKYNWLTDAMFLYGIYMGAVIHSKFTPTYFYRVSVETSLNFFKTMLKIPDPGVCHADDIGYLFKNPLTPKVNINSIEEKAMLRFVKLWTNFARFGNPSPQCQTSEFMNNLAATPLDRENVTVLDIGTSLKMIPMPELERMEYWHNLIKNSPANAHLNKE